MKKAILLALLFIFASIVIPAANLKAADQSSITRSSAEQRAINMINLTWTYSKDRNSNLDPKYAAVVEQPQQLKNVSSATFTGIPYDWGGIDTLDSHSYNAPWSNFLDAVNKGAYIGNVSSAGGFGLIPGTAGVDCSGFVQAAFNIVGYKLSTSTLFDKYFKIISLNEIKHMDILNYPGHHVVIFDRWGTRNGIYGAYTYEATANQYYGGIQGTKRYFLSLNAINSAYTPGRYINIIDDASTVSTPPAPPQQNKSVGTAAPKASNQQSSAVKPSQPNNSNGNTSLAKNDSSQNVPNHQKTDDAKPKPTVLDTLEAGIKNDSLISPDKLVYKSGLPHSMLIIFTTSFIFGISKKKYL